jgi:hypothetical protein
MAAQKYAKYFIEYDPKWFPKERRPVRPVCRIAL